MTNITILKSKAVRCFLAGTLPLLGTALWYVPKAIAAGVTVSGQVLNDLNSTGDINDTSNPGISNVTLALYQDNGTGNPTGGAIATTTTNASGKYSFPNVPTGNYVIVETNPSNYVSSGDSQGNNDDKIAVSVGSFDKTNNIFLDVNTALLDYGDAPNTYGTLSASSGASHTRDGKLFLGSGISGEADGQPNTNATGDTYDEGVTLSPSLGASYSTLIQAGIDNTAEVISSSTGYLNAWVDYNKNNVFDSGEQIFSNQPVSAGKNSLSFQTPPPNTIFHGSTFARFRVSPTPLSSPSALGAVSGGEVEDYLVNIADPVPDGAYCTTTGLVNGGFEQPDNIADNASASPKAKQTFVSGTIRTYDKQDVPGWNTTASDNRIEIWNNGASGVPSFSGNQFAEVNANSDAALFQDIATVPGSTLTWQFAHRGRDGLDTLDVKIGSPNAVVQQRRVSTDTNGWVVYRGTYVVPVGQFITRFAFDVVSTARGDNRSGNFIDAVQFSTNTCVTPVYAPTIDLDANNSTGATGNNYRGKFSGSGALNSAADLDVSITDDKTTIASAIITLINRPDGNSVESLSIDATAGGTISGVTNSYDSATGRLTLTGSKSLSDYQKIISTLKYSNSKTRNLNTNSRNITVQVVDSDNLRSNVATSTLSFILPPIVDLDGDDSSGVGNSDYQNSFIVGAGAVRAADTDVKVTEDGANLKSATITLTNRPNGTSESLSIDATAGGTISAGTVTSSYDATTGILTLNGDTTLTNYQKILATLKYNNVATNPDLIPRIITVQTVDTNDSLSSNVATSTILMKVPPTIDLDGNDSSGATGKDFKNTFVLGGGAVRAADTDVVITDEKNSLSTATITLSNRPNGTAESLSLDPTAGGSVTGVTASAYDSSTGQLTLTGNVSVTNYQKIIATLKYNNNSTSPDPTDRLINIQVTDSDGLLSNTATSTLSINLYGSSPEAGKVIINEVLYKQTQPNASTTNNDEFIELYNASSTTVDLSGWKLIDGNLPANNLDGTSGSITGTTSPYVFPSGTTLAPNQYAVIWVGSNNSNNQAAGAAFQAWLGKDSRLNDTGDDMWLYDNQTRIVDYMAYGSNNSSNQGINTPPPSVFWNANTQADLGGAANGRSISLTPNGQDGNNSICWELTTEPQASSKSAKTRGCPGYLPTVDSDSAVLNGTERVTSVGANNNDAYSSSPNILLVKRITATKVKGSSSYTNQTGYIDQKTPTFTKDYPYDDNDLTVPNPTNLTDPRKDTDKWPTPLTTYLRGAIDGLQVQPGDEVEYTIYFLSAGSTPAKNVVICDLVPAQMTFVTDAFNGLSPLDTGSTSNVDVGIAIASSTTTLPTVPTIYLTNLAGDDQGQYYPPGTQPPSKCKNPQNPGVALTATDNTSGIVYIQFRTDIPQATSQGDPKNSYGFVRFRARVK